MMLTQGKDVNATRMFKQELDAEEVNKEDAGPNINSHKSRKKGKTYLRQEYFEIKRISNILNRQVFAMTTMVLGMIFEQYFL